MTGLRPRAEQVAALASLMRAFAIHDRVQLVMACGSGKTLVSRWHAEAVAARRIVVFAPSRPLVAQLAREWARATSPSGWGFEAIAVFSDPATASGAAERDEAGADGAEPDWTGAQVRPTTDVRRVVRFLDEGEAGRAQVVFATYHSAPVVAEAIAATGTVFDLCVCDEAHRLAGSPSAAFRQVLDGRRIVARKRLFMTATPRLSSAVDGFSMEDPEIFGPVAHEVHFGQAIAAGLLCDYRVHVLAADTDVDDTSATPAAVLDAAARLGCSTILSFHGRVAKAAAFAEAINKVATPDGRTIEAHCISSSMPRPERDRILRWFGQPEPGLVKVVTNARLLGEGVDVPAVDAVCFSDQRTSVIDILQAIGRGLRPHPDKTLAHILVPIALPEDSDDDTELALSRFRLLWTVLRALRAHDHRFAVDVDRTARHAYTNRGVRSWRRRLGQVQFHLPSWAPDEETVWLRLVNEVSDAWERRYAACLAWGQAHPGRRMPRATVVDGMRVGEWAAMQRRTYSAGLLAAERVELLDQVPGWAWDVDAARFDETVAALRAYAEEHGSVEESPVAPSRFDGLYSAKPRAERLWLWMARQRQAYRRGSLPERRIRQLEALPGWTWTPVPMADLQMVDALEQFVAFERHAQVPDGHNEDGLPLGNWVWKVRRLKLYNRLHPALEAEIIAATPSQWGKGEQVRWQWEKPETQWRIAFTALRQYTAREGTANPTTTTVEVLDGDKVRIGQWVSLQRHLRGKGELDEARQELLERLPGWRWVGDVGGTVAAGEPIALPDHLRHGAAGAAARGCPCAECREYTRASGRTYLARKRAQREARGVPAGPVRQHLEKLEQQLQARLGVDRDRSSCRTLIAHTAGIPLGEVRRIATGARKVTAETKARMLFTTVELCLRNVSLDGSRGRPNQHGWKKVDAAPTQKLLADLERRGFHRGWIGRELGYVRSIQMSGDTCTKTMAAQIADLHRRVGDLVAPEVPRIPGIPPLAELLRQHGRPADAESGRVLHLPRPAGKGAPALVNRGA